MQWIGVIRIYDKSGMSVIEPFVVTSMLGIIAFLALMFRVFCEDFFNNLIYGRGLDL